MGFIIIGVVGGFTIKLLKSLPPKIKIIAK